MSIQWLKIKIKYINIDLNFKYKNIIWVIIKYIVLILQNDTNIILTY